jgi:hypothetical protein
MPPEEGGQPPQPGMGQPGGQPGMGPPGAQAMRDMQGAQPSRMSNQQTQPTDMVGHQPQMRPGMRPRPIVGGPG